ncbi:multiple sugar transport system substrate-binding protein [Actinoplanes lutulentus]|uniref:Carbohydrate ABC transporter substrate-binding protein (CUT1 family) n=1 Tax=Actinoplanes lutulentus TaxID=1287878 RepID=A0A327ZG58_9ACTN|nr:extracellular solute-binding protein [Actinoplanes lutulentus]MBB2941886.1 multiple sugar transport system substrate-binding protein [Actinoplanes lutulentus]RAK39803.1 carbohydrate ABC transporter substrate-binding protein (CUT1 family) [Actinoplanes lutulentus]
MVELYSRRSFVAGALTAGMLSTATGYLLTRSEPVTLVLATGADPTGARQLLVSMWNRLHPDITIEVVEVNSSTMDQYAKFTETRADIYNLDVIHIPRFAQAGRIAPVVPRNDISLLEPVRRVCQVENSPDEFWAIPFNTDVGMLYRRITDKRATDLAPSMSEVLAQGSFTAQLNTDGIATDEAFVINVLEQALAQDDAILDAAGTVSFSLGQWRTALAPLADALRRRRVLAESSEETTLRTYNVRDLRYMRNWPVWFPSVDRAERGSKAGTMEIRLSGLPTGVLGGQSLAVAQDSPHREEAEQVIQFLTDEPAQKLLASFGFAPPGLDAYIDAGVQAVAPHVSTIRTAVEAARPRPIHPGYPDFARAFKDHTFAYLYRGEELTQRFVEDLREALQ